MKRFTETSKWRDPWFRQLPPEMKLFWLYLCDECDNAGFWEPDIEMASFCIGAGMDLGRALEGLRDRVEVVPSGKWHIKKFVSFQFGELQNQNPLHRSVLKLIQVRALEGPRQGLPRALEGPQEKERNGEVQEKEKERNGTVGGIRGNLELGIQENPALKIWSPDPIQLRLNALFHRRNNTRWSEKELEAYEAVSPIDKADLELIEKFYTASIPKEDDWRRTELKTLLNNWNGEVDKARRFKPASCF